MLVTRRAVLVTRRAVLVTRRAVLVTRRAVLVTRRAVLVTRWVLLSPLIMTDRDARIKCLLHIASLDTANYSLGMASEEAMKT